jgi:insulysin
MSYKYTSVKSYPLDICNHITFDLENNIRVYYTTDPQITESCMALIVKVGFYNEKIPGLAHFLEHMLFNGTDKYPDSSAFQTFISANGGNTNAYTTHDHTCYYFSVQSSAFNEALERFSYFFTCPSLNPDSVNKEKEAVNAEHEKNIYNDGWRMNDIIKMTANNNHPITNFGTGCNKTLAIPNIHQHMKEFFNSYYSSDLMTIIITTNKNCDSVIPLIKQFFSIIPKKTYSLQKCPDKILNTPSIIKIVPIENTDIINMHFIIKSFKYEQNKSPINFLIYLLSNQYNGSMYDYLITNGLITVCHVHIKDVIEHQSILCILMQLTPVGVQHREHIINVVFDWINFLKKNINLLKPLYDQQYKLDKYSFLYPIKLNAVDFVRKMCQNLNEVHFAPEDALVFHIYNKEYTDDIKNNLFNVLSNINPTTASIIISSKEYDNDTSFSKETYYGTVYKVENKAVERTYTNVKFVLPELNKYLSIEDNLININVKIPKLLRKNKVKLYHLPTSAYGPSVFVQASLYLPNSILTKYNYVYTTLYFNTILSQINTEKYICESAQYTIDCSIDAGKLNIKVYGNYGKIVKVCNFIVNSIINLLNDVKDSYFHTAYYSLKNLSENVQHNPPYTRLNNLFLKRFCIKNYNEQDILNVMNEINETQLKINTINFAKFNLFKKCHITMMVSGNCLENTSMDLASIFEQVIQYESDEESFNDNDLCKKLKDNKDSYEIIPLNNKEDKNVAVGYYIFIGKYKLGITPNWEKDAILLNILNNIISTKYHSELRTNEEFGYIVTGTRLMYGTKLINLYYTFIVQSPHKTIDEIVNRTNIFMNTFRQYISEYTKEQFDNVVSGILSKYKEPYVNLIDMSTYIFNHEILTNFGCFNYKQIMINTISLLTLEDLIIFYDEKFGKRTSAIVGFARSE